MRLAVGAALNGMGSFGVPFMTCRQDRPELCVSTDPALGTDLSRLDEQVIRIESAIERTHFDDDFRECRVSE